MYLANFPSSWKRGISSHTASSASFVDAINLSTLLIDGGVSNLTPITADSADEKIRPA
jgi:hypothetical protein